ncbi:hypothetical protein GCM10009654_52950 [Streptomyces hebeiensis]|uniref:Uncharacterized protein n=1 Tax=Streptomyces hebeiensis TaxID=229486 RepID=A0ABN1V0W8_9ACTN
MPDSERRVEGGRTALDGAGAGESGAGVKGRVEHGTGGRVTSGGRSGSTTETPAPAESPAPADAGSGTEPETETETETTEAETDAETETETDAERRRRRAQFLRELHEAKALRERVKPRKARTARLRQQMRMRTFRW